MSDAFEIRRGEAVASELAFVRDTLEHYANGPDRDPDDGLRARQALDALDVFTAAPAPVGEGGDLRELRDAFADLLRHHTRAAHALHGDDRPDYPEEECWATGRRASAALRRFDALIAAPPPVGETQGGGVVTPLARIRELSIHDGDEDLTQIDSFTYSWHRGHETLRADGINYSGVFHPGDGCCQGNPCRYCGRAFYDEDPSDA